jgi:hypothetical protein
MFMYTYYVFQLRKLEVRPTYILSSSIVYYYSMLNSRQAESLTTVGTYVDLTAAAPIFRGGRF